MNNDFTFNPDWDEVRTMDRCVTAATVIGIGMLLGWLVVAGY